jgi:hypothetical protein
MKNKLFTGTFAIFLLLVFGSCKKYLDVVPDNVATLDNAFANRNEAKKFLFTCYSWMPHNGDINDDPAILGGDEFWMDPASPYSGGYFNVAQNHQSVVNPYGGYMWGKLYQGIRDCNIFLDNVGKVPDIKEIDKRRWIAEVQFLKAYYHFYLLRMFGPIPLMKENLPVNASVSQVKVSRAPVDSCFNYILQLINKAEPELPLSISDPAEELGRITQPIALSFKAKVMVYAASPLFNGNTQEAGLKNPDGTPLFNQTVSKAKWDSAVIACKKAIDICRQVGLKLYYYQPDLSQFNLSDTIVNQMNIRNSVCKLWNSEVIWANTQTNSVELQQLLTPWLDPSKLNNTHMRGIFDPPLRIVEMFYSRNGVPITEDKTWDYLDRFSLKSAGDSNKLYLRKGYTTASLNFYRGPRFYADLAFDGGIWYGQGYYDDKKPLDLLHVEGKFKQHLGVQAVLNSTVTGYYIKKLVNYQNVIGETTYSINSYPWPIIRLAGLYLLYAEALNESEGPGPDVYKYVDLVRQRAGLKSVETSWSTYSSNPSEYTTKQGMRSIIHRERLIELAFEGQRYWDLRRWKEAPSVLNGPIRGWNLNEETAAGYYVPRVLFVQKFGLKNYFFPITESTITNNRNLVQNLGW